MKKSVIGMVLATLVLSSCGGSKKEDFDKAVFLLSRGGGVNGLKAAELVEPYLSSTDIMTQMRAARLFAGGKINAAGLDGAKFLSNIAHGQSEGKTVRLLKAILTETIPVEVGGKIINSRTLNEAGEAADVYLSEAITRLNQVQSGANYLAVSTGNAKYCQSHKALCREKESVEVVMANVQFMRSLNVAIRLSTLGAGSFNVSQCASYFVSKADYIDTFSAALFEARTHYALAGLDDKFFEGANGQVDSSNSKPAGFIDDIQAEVDPDKDGSIPGSDSDKATILCNYLATQE